MKKNLIDLFFLELDRALSRTASVIVTGAAAGAIYGNVRHSVDIDFEIRLKRKEKRGRRNQDEIVQDAIRGVSSKLGISANYSDDISHWSMINYLNYRKSSIRYKRIGQMDIRLLAPEYWTIGKMARFLEIDLKDIIKVIKKKRLPAGPLVSLWARALRASPLSLAKGQFRRNVENFLNRHGKRLWGKAFDRQKAINDFRRLAGLKAASAAS
ncbi:hypothetical protein EPO44_15410 [bacterium]|nr:MAG: hypothetical protein EPO44_15410 [bacterium]